MKICLVSDSHDNRRLLAAAVADARERGAAVVLHAGDVVAPSTLRVLKAMGLPVHVIHGNNAGDLVTLSRYAAQPGNPIEYHGQDAALQLAGRRIFVVHYPHYARAMATTGDWDLVCHGHDHKANIEAVPNIKGGTTILADPGSVAGLDGPATYILVDLETMACELLTVPQWPSDGQTAS
jgi:putative phosphoesterase